MSQAAAYENSWDEWWRLEKKLVAMILLKKKIMELNCDLNEYGQNQEEAIDCDAWFQKTQMYEKVASCYENTKKQMQLLTIELGSPTLTILPFSEDLCIWNVETMKWEAPASPNKEYKDWCIYRLPELNK